MNWIDLRNELRGLIDGDMWGIPQGRWIVLRIMRVGEYSKYWNPRTRESVGGPKWKYDDFVIRAIARPGSSLSPRSAATPPLNDEVLSGLDISNAVVYGISFHYEFTRVPAIGDVVYEIDKYASIEKPTPPFVATDRLLVRYVHRMTGDYGRSEGFLLLAERMHGDY